MGACKVITLTVNVECARPRGPRAQYSCGSGAVVDKPSNRDWLTKNVLGLQQIFYRLAAMRGATILGATKSLHFAEADKSEFRCQIGKLWNFDVRREGRKIAQIGREGNTLLQSFSDIEKVILQDGQTT
jgi:hypothetical protein